MSDNHLESHPAVQDAFTAFLSDATQLALPLSLNENKLEVHPAVYVKDKESSFQLNLNLLDGTLKPTTSLYVLFRRATSISAITFVPYRAPEHERNSYLHHRSDLVDLFGGEHIETSFICKEIGEVTDARSWTERDEHRQANKTDEYAHENDNNCVKDSGYEKNKCRLCDRRMKNNITDKALNALRGLRNAGDCVQISLDNDFALGLDLQTSPISPGLVASHLPTAHPTFTFYRHPNTLLYFIFHSPDSAPVQQRMKHTMAIPGLVNVHAEDCGAHVDQKIEIHDPEDLVFEEKDEKVGKFRSLYLRGEWRGTESQYETMGQDGRFYDAVH